jgi:hypothetical protein
MSVSLPAPATAQSVVHEVWTPIAVIMPLEPQRESSFAVAEPATAEAAPDRRRPTIPTTYGNPMYPYGAGLQGWS